MAVQPGVPQGTVYTFDMLSKDSKLYPGIMREADTCGQPDPNDPAKLIVTTSHPGTYTRHVSVYVPRAVCGGDCCAVYRRRGRAGQGAITALDNLIAEKKVPAMIAILGSATAAAMRRAANAGLEYDTMSGKYAEFVESEVLPLVESQ